MKITKNLPLSLISFLVISASLLSACNSMLNPKPISNQILATLGISSAPASPQHDYQEFKKIQQLLIVRFVKNTDMIYYLKLDGSVNNIFSYNLNTKIESQVSKNKEPIKTFFISGDEKRIVYQSDKGGNEIYQIYYYDLTNNKTTLISNEDGSSRAFLEDFDGTHILYTQSIKSDNQVEIVRYNVETAEMESLVTQEEIAGALSSPILSKDGKYLSFVNFMGNDNVSLYLKNLETPEIILIKADKSPQGLNIKNNPSYIDEQYLYYLSNDGADSNRLWCYGLATRSNHLASDFPYKNNLIDINFANDGQNIIVSYRGPLKDQLAVLDANYKNAWNQAIPPSEVSQFSYNPYDSSYQFFMESSPNVPGKYYVSHKTEALEFYNANRSAIPDEQFSKNYSQFIKSFDGLRIPTHMVIPNGISAENKAPLLVWVHGGPQDHDDPVYNNVFQFFANNGFVVVDPNVRGSSGFGSQYQDMDNGDWGGGHVKDLIAVTQYMKKQEFIDNENIFIMGGSFGGFSVMSAITQYPNEYQAAINIFGPVELASFIESWFPIAQQYFITEIGADPRIDNELNKRISPFYHTDQIRTPLQIHHGRNDIRVPYTQSESIYQKLKAEGRDVEFLTYENEGHGFVHAESMDRLVTESMRFLISHLK